MPSEQQVEKAKAKFMGYYPIRALAVVELNI